MKQGLYGPYKFAGRDGILQYIRQAGCIQFDPIDICGKNPELVLQSRVKGFKKHHLYDLLYKDRLLFDYFDKVMSIIPIEDWPYFSYTREHYKNGGRGKETVDEISSHIFKIIEEKGPVSSSDIGFDDKVSWHWGPTKLARAALESLYFRGDLIIHHKKNTRKFYDLAHRHLSSETIEKQNPLESRGQFTDWRLLRRINAVGMLWNRPGDAFIGMGGFKAAERNGSFGRLLETGKITEVNVDDIKYPLYMDSRDSGLLKESSQSHSDTRTEFIAPLDNMLWDRRLIKELFDFEYKWEIYTPAKDRKYGYYVLPLLHGGKFAGRVEIKKNSFSGSMEIANLWLEPGTRETKKLHIALTRRMKSFNEFHKTGQ